MTTRTEKLVITKTNIPKRPCIPILEIWENLIYYRIQNTKTLYNAKRIPLMANF